MKKLLISLAFFCNLYANEGFIKDYEDFESAIGAFNQHVQEYETNIYFYEDKKGYHVAYDPTSSTETSYSFLQIFNDKKFENVLRHYRQIEDKRELYIKKFHKVYFLRLRNTDIKHTNSMYLLLKKKYPHMYHSKAVAKSKVKKPKKKIKYEIVYLKDKYEKANSNTTKNIVLSAKRQDKIPALKNNMNIKSQKIIRQGGLDTLADIEHSVSNFALVRGDILGLKNAGLYGLEPFNNYGILCSPSESVLFLVSHEEIKSVYDLRSKTLSIGNISDIAQVYLQKVAKNSGILQDIRFKSYSINKSMNALDKKEIDAFFLFAPISYMNKFLDKGFYISSVPKDFYSVLNTKEGLKRLKYKINGRMISSFKTPTFLVSPLASADIELVDKIGVVADKFGCMDNVKIPNAFYGQLHPELLNAIAKKKENDLASLVLDDLAAKRFAIKVSFYNKKIEDDKHVYLYKVHNTSNEDINVSFDHFETKLFDRSTIKPHHLFKINTKKANMKVLKKSEKLVSFTYENPFASRIKPFNLILVFKDERYDDNYVSISSRIGDK